MTNVFQAFFRLQNLILICILTLAFFLRINQLDEHGIFFDEKATLLVSQGMAMEGSTQKNCFNTPNKSTFTPQEFWQEKSLQDYFEANRRSDIGNSPAYYLVLHFWTKAFGLSDYALRFFSVLWSIATIILLFFFVKEHFKNNNLALICAGLMAIEPFFIAVSQQARNYSMSFFFTLLATHIFLKIIKREEKERSAAGLYWTYGFLSAVCLLSHFLTATVFMAHGLYVLLFVRKLRPWIFLPLSLCIGGAFFGYWITFGGGDYTFKTLAYQAKVYYQEAHSVPNPHAGYIDPATPKNVLKKATPIFLDLFILANGLINKMIGFRNLALAILVALLSVFSLNRYFKNQQTIWLWGIIALNAIAFFVYSTGKFQFLAFVNLSLLFYLLLHSFKEKKEVFEQRLLVFMAILAFLPSIFLVIMTFKNGHTFGLTQRYSGFSFPYSIIFVGLAISQVKWEIKPLNFFIFAVLFAHLVYVGQTIQEVLNDVSVKYNYRSEARSKNPYPAIAQKLTKYYQTGDTILYPSYIESFYAADTLGKVEKQSNLDAQYVNMYLPKDAQFIQKVNITERNKVFLKKKDGRLLEIFDLKEKKYRY